MMKDGVIIVMRKDVFLGQLIKRSTQKSFKEIIEEANSFQGSSRESHTN